MSYDPRYLAEHHTRADLVRLREDHAQHDDQHHRDVVRVLDKAIAIKDVEALHALNEGGDR